MKVRTSTLINRLEKVKLDSGHSAYDIYHYVARFDETSEGWRGICSITRHNIVSIAYYERVVEAEELPHYELKEAQLAFDSLGDALHWRD